MRASRSACIVAGADLDSAVLAKRSDGETAARRLVIEAGPHELYSLIHFPTRKATMVGSFVDWQPKSDHRPHRRNTRRSADDGEAAAGTTCSRAAVASAAATSAPLTINSETAP